VKDALLLNMPFVSPSWPAIGISILKARLREEGLSCDVAYPNLLFAERLGLDVYNLVDDFGGDGNFVGDWVFARHLFGDALDERAYIDLLRLRVPDDRALLAIVGIRDVVGLFLEECVVRYRIAEYAVIGFSTTFEQNVASLCLARLIKSRHPEKVIVFGGVNCDGEMGHELVRSFPWIDFVCRGEAEVSFPALVRAVRTSVSPASIPGLVHRRGTEVVANPPGPAIVPLDRVPRPDYDDYFAAVAQSRLASSLRIVLLVEGARGCWWGAKAHCTFCGLNGSSMAFRSKSGDRVYDELRTMRDRYGQRRFICVDNIMDMGYLKTLLPRLKAEPLGISLFYEIKSNLTRAQVELLADAGVDLTQVGIESLNTHVLSLMRKGVSALQNIQTLKWCKQYGIHASWNLLYGFPGETPDDYAQTAAIMEALGHLPPPGALARVTLDRFSPYHDHPERYGMTRVRPLAVFSLIYALPVEQVTRLVSFFDYECGLEPYAYLQGVRERLDTWRAGASDSSLTRAYGADPELLITDTRPGRRAAQFALSGAERIVYDYCDSTRSVEQIRRHLDESCAVGRVTAEWLAGFLDRMVASLLMVREGPDHLSLAMDPSPPEDRRSGQAPQQHPLPLLVAPPDDADDAGGGVGVAEHSDRQGVGRAVREEALDEGSGEGPAVSPQREQQSAGASQGARARDARERVSE
jgi:ribosomal peptide maturation radical SAM protein 1